MLVIERPVWHRDDEDEECSSSANIEAVVDVASIETGDECNDLDMLVWLLTSPSI
jgi:hypothetical protein